MISRDNVLEESFNQFKTTGELDFKRAIHIFYVDEVAHDVGGVYREWYTNLFESIFSPQQSFFTILETNSLGKGTYFIPEWTPLLHKEDYLEFYEFIGKVLGKAIFDKITLKTNFNIIIIKHILGMKIKLEDLKYLDEGYYQSLSAILNQSMVNNNDLNFTWNVRKDRQILEQVDLVENGSNIYLDEMNKNFFIEKV